MKNESIWGNQRQRTYWTSMFYSWWNCFNGFRMKSKPNFSFLGSSWIPHETLIPCRWFAMQWTFDEKKSIFKLSFLDLVKTNIFGNMFVSVLNVWITIFLKFCLKLKGSEKRYKISLLLAMNSWSWVLKTAHNVLDHAKHLLPDQVEIFFKYL